MTVDWSQFSPVEETPSKVDWSAFTPVEEDKSPGIADMARSAFRLINPLDVASPEKREVGGMAVDALTYLPRLGAEGGGELSALAQGKSLDEAIGVRDLIPSATQAPAATPAGKGIEYLMGLPGEAIKGGGEATEKAARQFQSAGLPGIPTPFGSISPEAAGPGGEALTNLLLLAAGGKAADGVLPKGITPEMVDAFNKAHPEPQAPLALGHDPTAPAPADIVATRAADLSKGDPVTQQTHAAEHSLSDMVSQAADATQPPPGQQPVSAPATPPASSGPGGGLTPPPAAVANALHAATGGDRAKVLDTIKQATAGKLKPGETPESLADMVLATAQQGAGGGAAIPTSVSPNEPPPRPTPGVDKSRDVPLAGGVVLPSPRAPGHVAIDSSVPQWIKVPEHTNEKGETFPESWVDQHEEIDQHEKAEFPKLEELGYQKAHDIHGNAATDDFARRNGMDPEVYKKAQAQAIESAKTKAEAGQATNINPALDQRPYQDAGQMHLLGPARTGPDFPEPQKLSSPPARTTPEDSTTKPAAPEAFKPTGNAITDRFAQKMQDYPAARDEYSKIPETEGGTVLNTDTARELSPDYLKDRTKSADVHEPASAFIKQLYAEKLSQPTPAGKEPTVLFTAGGTGAGKSTGLDKLAGTIKPEITYDTNMNTYGSAKAKIEQALDAGRKVKILYTYRDPAEALRQGALKRASRQEADYGSGRTVPMSEHLATHTGSYDVVNRLAKEYNGDSRVEIVALDNSRGKGNAEFVPLDQIPNPRTEGLNDRLNQQLEEAHAAGEISDSIHAGFKADSSRESPAVGAGDSGQLEPQRPQQRPDEVARPSPEEVKNAVAELSKDPRWPQFLAENAGNPRLQDVLHEAARLANEATDETPETRVDQTTERSAPAETDASQPARRSSEVSEPEAGDGSATARAADKPEPARAEVDDYPAEGPLSGASVVPSAKDLSDLAHKIVPELDQIVEDALLKTAPMAAGSDEARAVAKDFANEMRLATHEAAVADAMLRKNFTPEQLEKMWQAADEQSVMEQSGKPGTGGKGLAKLTPEEAKVVRALQAKARKVYEQARDLGMVEGEGLPSYTPRMVVVMGEGGIRPAGADKTRPTGGVGANVRTTSPNLKQRKHMTTEETEAAARAKFGDSAKVVQNIRTLPLATAKLQRAVAGRQLINRVKEIGNQTGATTVSSGVKPNDGYGWFTLDHPAFQTWRPKFDDNGKVMQDAEGEPIFEKVPIYVRSDFKGPLKAVMSENQGEVYKALMNLKAKTMTVIMYSPLIHNAVEWGRAIPAAPGKTLSFRIYVEGNRAKNDPATMREAIKAGLAPIGHGGAMQDITGIEAGDQIAPGRSWTAQVLSAIPNLFSAKAGDAVKRAIDKAGDFWHNTLLWDRVADLQMGLYTNMRDAMVKKGMSPETAQRVAAHLANRYAGALPKEAMSAGATKAANLLLFSRTFTLGNLGAMKDALTGLPRDVQAQIKRDAPEEAAKAKTYARRKALGIIALDVGLMYIGNSILQSAISMMRGDTDLETEEKEYLDRALKLMRRVKEDPTQLLHPMDNMQSLSSTSKNEPGKQDRILVGHAADGTAIYMRNPVGKIGEEFTGWLSEPLKKLLSKQGTLARPVYETITNDKGFGRKVYDPYDNTNGAAIRNMGKIVANIVGDQVPMQAIDAAKDYYNGVGDARLNMSQVLGPFGGVTFSKGAPGGEAVGEMYAAKDKETERVAEAMPAVHRMIQAKDIDGAIAKMQELGMSPSYMRWVIATQENPSLRLSKKAMQDFNRYATPEERERMDAALSKRP